jgi:hypothetical protein
MITDKIDEYLNRKKKSKPCLSEGTDINSDILELLNSLDNDFLDDRQIELRDKIISANMTITTDDDITIPENDIDNDGIVDDFGDDGFADDFATEEGYEDDATPPESIGDKELYGYDESDVEIAEGKKKIKTRKPLLSEGKIKKTKKFVKKTK